LESARALRFAARQAGATDPATQAGLTASMLRGEEGRQAIELERLLDWLRADGPPEIVHLSNALLLGLARRLRAELGCAVVCSLQDEDVWVDAMRPADARALWDLIAARASDADAFVAVSRAYADRMIAAMRLPASRVHVIHPGVEPDPAPAVLPFDPPVIGFLARMGEGLGLDILVDAFLLLRRRPGFARVRLAATGGQLGPDARFVRRLRERLASAGAGADAVLHDTYEPARRREFLRSLTVLSVPSTKEDGLGLYLLEAAACGVPFVQPRRGAYPEVAALTGGGVICDDATPAALAGALAGFLSRPDDVRAAGRRAHEAIRATLTPAHTAAATLSLYTTLTPPRSSS
jgi:glycosyltransferase involved in cell wall biosynthesis